MALRTLRKRPSYRNLHAESRRRHGAWGRRVYFAILALLAIWLFDLFAAPLFVLRAEGLVMRDRFAIESSYVGRIETLPVVEGQKVSEGDVLAILTSHRVLAEIADLTADQSDQIARRSDIRILAEVAENALPAARQRRRVASEGADAVRNLRADGLAKRSTQSDALEERFDSLEREKELEAQLRVGRQEIERISQAIAQTGLAIQRLEKSYANGVVRAPRDGVVGDLDVAPGSVVMVGEQLMSLYTGVPFVLAYLPTHRLYEIEVGDEVVVDVGTGSHQGRIAKLYPLADTVPPEFQRTFEPRSRQQLARIEVGPELADEPLFTKTAIFARGFFSWLP